MTTKKGITGEKILLGIGIGCLGLIVLFVVAAAAIGYWAYMPGDQVPTASIIGQDSAAVFRLENLGEDGGVDSLLRTVMREARRLQAEQRRNLPPMARFFANFQQPYSDREAEQMRKFLPREVTMTLEASPDGEGTEPLVAVNLSRFPRLIRFFVSLAKFEDDDLQLQFVESTLLIASRPALERAVERLRNPASSPPADPELLAAFQSANPRWDFHGAVVNRDGLLDQLARRLLEETEEEPTAESEALAAEASEEAFSDIRKLTFGIDIVSDDEAEGEIVIDCASEKTARALLEYAADSWQSGLSDAGLKPETSIDRSGNLITLRARATGLRQALIDALQKASSKQAEEEPEESGG